MTPGSINGDDEGSLAGTSKTRTVMDHANLKKHNKNTKEEDKDKEEDNKKK